MKNYKNHKDTIIKYISIVDIVRIIDYATELSSLIPQENEILDDFDEIFSQLIQTEKELRTNKKCPHCGGTLYLSDSSFIACCTIIFCSLCKYSSSKESSFGKVSNWSSNCSVGAIL